MLERAAEVPVPVTTQATDSPGWRRRLGRVSARPQQLTQRRQAALTAAVCVAALGLVLLGETVTFPGVTLGSYGLLVVLLSTWMLPTRAATAIASLALCVPVVATVAGGVDRLTAIFQFVATLIMATAGRFAVAALQRGERIRTELSDQLLESERRRADESVARLAELHTLHGRLADFTADAAHELRAPLATMRAVADRTLARRRSFSEYRESLTTVRNEVIRLADMSNALLMLATADNGQLALQREVLDMADFLSDAAARWQTVVDENHQSLHLALPEDGKVDADATLLSSLVDNLLANACRHTPGGGLITLAASRSMVGWEISVTDTGEGIAEELKPRIFERFRRGDPARGRYSGGAGLGLAVCRTIARLHGGDIRVADTDEHGARFVVELPGAP